ncbi:helix-turn-helix transcriptional regulator [Aeromonas bivalvium]|uniref:Helix-turn-helix transcriptional regulator n=1 Tax=Aeromonas bivalvium TaxID=440079 RepID=A0ABW9GKF4_9GAMM|nr:helix-turn-helix transcriptional regulator [Aeromonas bivalvium]
MKTLVSERVSPYISQLYECGINDSDIKLVVDKFRYDLGGSSTLLLLRDDDKSDGLKLFASGLSEAQQHFYLQHHRQDVWFNHYLDKGCQGVVSANEISDNAGLLASFGAQFALGGVCRVKDHGLSSLCGYRSGAQSDFTVQERHLVADMYAGFAAWSQHYWNLLALETQNYQLQQLVRNHNKPSAIIDDKGYIHYSNTAFNRITDENVELRTLSGLFSLQSKDQQRQFKEMLAGFAYLLPGASAYLCVPRQANLRPLLIQCTLMSGLTRYERFVELVLRDPEHAFNPDIEALASLYPLTVGEKELLMLMSKGYSSNDIAELRGVKVETVRSTLKGVFKKTDCHSQSELLLLLQSIS